MVLIDDILEEWNIHPDDINLPEEYKSEALSYILMAEEESFPREGMEVHFGDPDDGEVVTLRVLSIYDNVIEKVECERN